MINIDQTEREHYLFIPNEFVQSKNGNFCGVIFDKQMIKGQSSYTIALQKDFDYAQLNSFDKDFIDKHMIVDSFDMEKYGAKDRLVLIVPLKDAYVLTRANKQNSKKLLTQ
jgi:hypothetical protein